MLSFIKVLSFGSPIALLGFGSTIAEPALIAVAARAAIVVSESGLIENSSLAQTSFRSPFMIVALVGTAWSLAYCVSQGWPLHLMIIGGILVHFDAVGLLVSLALL